MATDTEISLLLQKERISDLVKVQRMLDRVNILTKMLLDEQGNKEAELLAHHYHQGLSGLDGNTTNS